MSDVNVRPDTQPNEDPEVEFETALAEEKQEGPPSEPEAENAFMRPRPEPVPHPTLEDAGADQAPVQPPVNSETGSSSDAEEDLEILVPKIAAKEWQFGHEEGENPVIRTYLQQELSVVGFAQWTGLVGEFLDDAMSGENALTMRSLLSPPSLTKPGQPTIQDFQDADVFVHAIGKLVQFAPEFLMKSVCIWLDVPDYEWELVQALMKKSPAVGGMSHDMFQEIIEIFIDQNFGEINRFFRVRQQQIRARYRARAKEANPSRSSKR